jgi:small subunit ribosomal protein S14
MKHALQRDARRRRAVAHAELQRRVLQSLLHDLRLPEDHRYRVMQMLQAIPASSSAVRVKNRCHLTGRARGILRRFRMSRFCFRALASRGHLPGITKASW